MRAKRRSFDCRSIAPRLAILLLSFATLCVRAQYEKAPTVGESNPAMTMGDRAQPIDQRHFEELEKLFLARQKEMEENTDRILRLATDLNAAINHPSPQSHLEPSDSVHKAETIAKLAKNIRQKMASNDVH